MNGFEGKRVASLRFCFLITCALMLLAPTALVAGDLEPPDGAPDSTMKTLNEVEPRIPIPGNEGIQTYDAFVIDKPGSYYLTGNRSTHDAFCIEITNKNVVVDLCGYTLRSNTLAGGDGVRISGCDNVQIMNGIISGYGDGVKLWSANGCTIKDIKFVGNYTHGVNLSVECSFNSIENCLFKHPYPESVVEGTAIFINSGDENQIKENQVRGNPGNGIYIGGNKNVVSNNVVSSCRKDGIFIQGGYNLVMNNISSYNQGESSSGFRNAARGNVYVKNVGMLNTTNFTINNYDNNFPITNDTAKAGPWDNIEY